MDDGRTNIRARSKDPDTSTGPDKTSRSPLARTVPDAAAYLIAVAGFALALLGFVTMAGIAVALGVTPPNEFWLLGTSIAGVLTGILVPPTKAKQEQQVRQAALARLAPQDALTVLAPKTQESLPPRPAPTPLADKYDWRLVILGSLFVVCGGVGLWFVNAPYDGSTQLFAVAGATGATALGILVPTPLKPAGSTR